MSKPKQKRTPRPPRVPSVLPATYEEAMIRYATEAVEKIERSLSGSTREYLAKTLRERLRRGLTDRQRVIDQALAGDDLSHKVLMAEFDEMLDQGVMPSASLREYARNRDKHPKRGQARVWYDDWGRNWDFMLLIAVVAEAIGLEATRNRATEGPFGVSSSPGCWTGKRWRCGAVSSASRARSSRTRYNDCGLEGLTDRSRRPPPPRQSVETRIVHAPAGSPAHDSGRRNRARFRNAEVRVLPPQPASRSLTHTKSGRALVGLLFTVPRPGAPGAVSKRAADHAIRNRIHAALGETAALPPRARQAARESRCPPSCAPSE
jgi:hypothetical protein